MASYIIEQILKTKKITDYLASKGHHPRGHEVNGKLRYLCPIHAGDKAPSFYVYLNSEFENFYCYGCLEENELIWTFDGLRPIASIKAGDQLWDVNGVLQTVLCTERKQGNCLGIKLGSFRDPLVLTKDHTCLIIKSENAIKSFRRLFFNKAHGRLTFRSDLSDRPAQEKSVLIEIKADKIRVGDYFVFPIIPNRNNAKLSSEDAIKSYTKGPKVNRIKNLPANPSLAWFYGLYAAEGSISGNRVVNLTLNRYEDHLANRAVIIVRNFFGIHGTTVIKKDKNTLNVTFCSADLSAHLSSVFGDGACSKHIPSEMIQWEKSLQIAFLNGYRSGDGSKKNGTTVSCSLELATGVFGIAVQAGLCPSFHKPVMEKIDTNGTKHKKWYSVGFRKKDGVNGFHEIIKNTNYYIMPVFAISECGNKNVVDISVSNSETFITKLGATHNCKSKYHIIHLYCILEGVSLRDAIKALSGDLKIDVEAELTHAINEIENDTSILHEYSPPQLALLIGRQMYEYYKAVKTLQARNQTEKVNLLIDKSLINNDIDTLKMLYDVVPDTIAEAVRMHMEAVEKETVKQ